MDPKERGWMGKGQCFSSVPKCFIPRCHVEQAGSDGWGTAAGSPGWFSCIAMRALKRQPAGSQHRVQMQQTAIGGSKLNLSRTLVKAHGGPSACRATGRTTDPFSCRAGRRGAGRLSLK